MKKLEKKYLSISREWKTFNDYFKLFVKEDLIVEVEKKE